MSIVVRRAACFIEPVVVCVGVAAVSFPVSFPFHHCCTCRALFCAPCHLHMHHMPLHLHLHPHPHFPTLRWLLVAVNLLTVFCVELHVSATTTGSVKASAKGDIFLTTRRICFVAYKPDGAVRALDIPLTHLEREEFKQPIFGANYLQGIVAPLRDMGITAPFKFKLQFREGGFTTFLHFFFRLMDAVRKESEAARARFFDSVGSGAVQSSGTAYVDPGDPTKLYVSQPAVPTAPPAYAERAYATRVGYAPVPTRSSAGAVAPTYGAAAPAAPAAAGLGAGAPGAAAPGAAASAPLPAGSGAGAGSAGSAPAGATAPSGDGFAYGFGPGSDTSGTFPPPSAPPAPPR